jgi:hypothetical protein
MLDVDVNEKLTKLVEFRVQEEKEHWIRIRSQILWISNTAVPLRYRHRYTFFQKT